MAAILVIDGDPGILESYRVGLEACGHAVISASDAGAGLDRLREGGIDAVVLDHALPGGVDALVTGLQRLPDPPPLVLISGEIEAPRMSARLGAAEFLLKPCQPEELAHVIARVTTLPGGLDDQPTGPVERGGE